MKCKAKTIPIKHKAAPYPRLHDSRTRANNAGYVGIVVEYKDARGDVQRKFFACHQEPDAREFFNEQRKLQREREELQAGLEAASALEREAELRVAAGNIDGIMEQIAQPITEPEVEQSNEPSPEWNTETDVEQITISFTHKPEGYVPTLTAKSARDGKPDNIRCHITPGGNTLEGAWGKCLEHLSRNLTSTQSPLDLNEPPPSRLQFEMLLLDMQADGIDIGDEATYPLYDVHRFW